MEIRNSKPSNPLAKSESKNILSKPDRFSAINSKINLQRGENEKLKDLNNINDLLKMIKANTNASNLPINPSMKVIVNSVLQNSIKNPNNTIR